MRALQSEPCVEDEKAERSWAVQRRYPSLHKTHNSLKLAVYVADAATDLTAPDTGWPVSDWITAINPEQLTKLVTVRAEDPLSGRSSSLDASGSGARGSATMLSFSSFSIRDILSGRVTRGGGARAAWGTCAADSGFRGPGLTHRGERHSAGLSVSEAHTPLSPDAFSGETVEEQTAKREGEFMASWSK